ncbi:hypothetical protein GCM10007916_34810 [Psychromonas marina]|uniref:Uncharacterized protein n=1 Tax=Psychromonas marina TaxID=88364 RepID=A0ABQ6E511_9GAMM|nr:hypothetical protein [Psychromonas marina]GLS92410.1 hypothetical protein GCM10007916_34810 [Psychromonas marina]
MSILFIFALITTITYIIFKFAQQEAVEEQYQEAILDIESLQDWAISRPTCPFGMKSQIDTSNKLLHQAKDLRNESEYQQAYRVALQSLHAIDKAQRIYISACKKNAH